MLRRAARSERKSIGLGDEAIAVDRHRAAGDVLDDQLARAGRARAQNRHADAHRLGADEGKTFARGWKKQGIGGLIGLEGVAVAQQRHAVAEVVGGDAFSHLRLVRAVAGHKDF